MSEWGSKIIWPASPIITSEGKELPINPWPVSVPFKELQQAAKDASLHDTEFMQNGKHISLEKLYNNVKPTHDPYSNPNAHIYYECQCGAILDPGTKSFAALNNAASEKGWKVRWGAHSYIPYCVECGKDVE